MLVGTEPPPQKNPQNTQPEDNDILNEDSKGT